MAKLRQYSTYRLYSSEVRIPISKRKVRAFSLFVLSYLSLFSKVGRNYNSWLLSRSAFVLSCDLSVREGCIPFGELQRKICLLLLCRNLLQLAPLLCNAFIWSERGAICFLSPVLFYLMSGEKCWRYPVTTSTNEWDPNFYNSTCIKLQLRRKIHFYLSKIFY